MELSKNKKIALIREVNKPVRMKNLTKYMTSITAPSLGYVQIDLMDMSNYGTRNKNYNYALIIIDIYSRYAWVFPLKNKSASEVSKHFIEWNESKPFGTKDELKTVFADEGKEFLGTFQQYLKKHEIKFKTTNSANAHQVLAERLIRTIKEQIKNEWVLNNNFDWITPLDDIMETYNNKVHSTTKRKPIDVLNGKQPYIKPSKPVEPDIMVGEYVRILQVKSKFDKPTLKNNYSINVYKVISSDNQNYTLDNGKVYPRWKLLKSEFRPTTKKEEPEKERKKLIREKKVKEYFKREDIKEDNVIKQDLNSRPKRERKQRDFGAFIR